MTVTGYRPGFTTAVAPFLGAALAALLGGYASMLIVMAIVGLAAAALSLSSLPPAARRSRSDSVFVPREGRLAEPRIITPTSLAGPRMSAVTALSRVLILTTPDGGDAPAYHRSQWTTSSKGRRSGRTRGRSPRSAG
jgi:hypothetical protein